MFDQFSMRSNLRTARLSAAGFASIAAAVALMTSLPVRADVIWTLPAGQSGDWSTALNWGGAVPGSSDNALIINGGTANITTIDASVCYNLYLGDPNSANSGGVQMSGGGLSLANELIGNTGPGTFIQSGGVNSIGYSLYLAVNPGSSGAYNLSGGGQLSALTDYVGVSGSGTFTQSGGINTVVYSPYAAVNTSTLYLGYNPGSSGTYNLGGSGVLFNKLPLSRQQHWQQRRVQSQRHRPVVGILRVRGLFRLWSVHAVRREQHGQQLSLPGQQYRQRRQLHPQRQRAVVGRRRVRGLFRHGGIPADRRHERDPPAIDLHEQQLSARGRRLAGQRRSY